MSSCLQKEPYAAQIGFLLGIRYALDSSFTWVTADAAARTFRSSFVEELLFLLITSLAFSFQLLEFYSYIYG